jgi:hypothetical protein
MAGPTRVRRLQIMLAPLELTKVDDWRFLQRMPSRAAAVRALLKLGLASEGANAGRSRLRSQDFSEGDSQK